MPHPAVLRLEFRTPQARAAEFQRLIKDMGADATGRYGATGVDAVAAGQTEQDERWVVTVRFEDEDALRRWRASREAAHWRERLEQLSIEQPLVRIRDGVEVWFGPAGPHAASPPKGKLAVLSAVGI